MSAQNKRDEVPLSGLAAYCRFVFEGPMERVLRDALAHDVANAHLSPAFRTYYRLRSLVPLSVRQLLQRYRSIEQTSDWYFNSEFEQSLMAACALAGGGAAAIHPWPDGARFAFVPTHDVETADGMRRIERIANLEEDLGFRSSWNIVPHKYPIDRGLLRDLQSRGFEIGVHGFNHDGKLFTSRAVFDRRVPAINAALQEFGAVGFRAPMVHRNLDWMQSLEIEYDASCFDCDPYQAMPGGVCGAWPFIVGRFVELPYTLPQDHTLFIALGETSGRIWETKLDYVARLGGMALFITHPDYLDPGPRMDSYRALLEKARDCDAMWHALPRDVARWWRERDQSQLNCDTAGVWTIDGPAAARGRAADFRVAVNPRNSSAKYRDLSTSSTTDEHSRPSFEWHDFPTILPTSNSKASAALT